MDSTNKAKRDSSNVSHKHCLEQILEHQMQIAHVDVNLVQENISKHG